MQTNVTAVQKSQEVSALLEMPDSRIIAGGTTFRPGEECASQLVDISGLQGLDGIKQKGSRIEIGPLALLSTLADASLLKTYVPVLSEAAAGVTPAEIRERGTLGGNLANERIGDCAAALLAWGAKLTIKTGDDFRDLLIDRFWSQDGKNDLNYDEWITRITLQMPKETQWGAAFGKTGEWSQTAEPPAAAAVRLSVDEKDIITGIRGALRMGKNGIRRMFPLEKALKNQPASAESFGRAVSAVTSALHGDTDQTLISGLLSDVLQRSFTMAAERRNF